MKDLDFLDYGFATQLLYAEVKTKSVIYSSYFTRLSKKTNLKLRARMHNIPRGVAFAVSLTGLPLLEALKTEIQI